MLLTKPLKKNMTLAEGYCAEHGWDAHEVLSYQYLIHPKRQKIAPPKEWSTRIYGDWKICHDPKLPATDIVDASGQTLGVCYGVAIGPDNAIVQDRLTLPFDADNDRFWDRFEELTDYIRGRYVLLVQAANTCCVYGDPTGDMGIVYDPTTRRIGASVPILLDRDLKPTADPATTVENKHFPFRFGKTSDANVKRMGPNHRLELSDFSVTRFWPKDIPEVADPSQCPDIAAKIAHRLAQNIGAFTSAYKTAIPISGGYDSTILLQVAAHAGFKPAFTLTHRTNWISGYDALMGYEAAQTVGVEHIFLDAMEIHKISPEWQNATQIGQDVQWMRTGFCLPKVKPLSVLAPMLLPPVDIVLRGNVMEMLGGRFHKAGTVSNVAESLKLIFGRKPEDTAEERAWHNAYAQWLADLPPKLPNRMGLDLSFVENLYPYAMAITLQSMPMAFYINPFADRRLLRYAMSVPSDIRVSGDFYRMLLTYQDGFVPLHPKLVGREDEGGARLAEFLAQAEPQTQKLLKSTPPNFLLRS